MPNCSCLIYSSGMNLLALLLAINLTPETPGTQYKQPQMAALGDTVAVTFGAGNAVYFASSRDAGRTFSKPVRVAEDGKLALGRHRGPRVAMTGDAIVISAVVAEKGGGQDGDLVAWRSTDGGRTWSKGVRVSDVPAAAREGLHGMAAGKGIVFATWLDLRGQGTRLYGSISRDGGATWSKNRLVYESPDGRICECCHPSAKVAGDGKIYVMWRNALGGSRDMYLAVSTDGGETFRSEKLGEGTWPLNACPMDGGAVALDGSGGVLTVWRRNHSIYLSRPGRPEEEIGMGKDGVVAFGVGGKIYAAWSGRDGLQLKAPGADVITRPGAYVDLVTAGKGVVAAWEHDGVIVIEPLP